MWAYEYEAGKFIAGEILGDTLYMYAPTGRGEKWVMNSEGIVLEYSSEPFHKSDEIIAGINAHYGTSFYQEDDIDKDFTVGETMPNWNAYEKIEMPIPYYAVTTGGENTFAAGYLVDNVWHVYFYANNNALRIDKTGLITGDIVSADGLIQGLMLPKMRDNGIEVESYVQDVVDWNVGETIPNVEQYTFIT